MFTLLGALAVAAPLSSVDVTPQGFRASYDVVVRVASDGTLQVDGKPAIDAAVGELVHARAAVVGPDLRVVVAADPRVPYARVVEVLDVVEAATDARVALEIGAGAAPIDDPLNPLGKEVVNLDEQEFGETFHGYRPKRHQYPQNPYGSTDFTAYTRESGEVRIGLASTSIGLFPRTQVGTYPILDLLGVYNIQGKWNFARTKRLDLAASAGTWVVPVTQLVGALYEDGRQAAGGKGSADELFVDRVNYVSLGLTSSLQIVGGWSVHAGLGYSRATAKGALDFNNLPTIIVPGGGKVGGDLTIVPRVTGQILDFRFATDLRFNRRDSLIFQYAATPYVAASGAVSGDLEGIPKEYSDLDFAIAYQQQVKPADSYRASLAWQFSWRKVDLRFGAGVAAIDLTWFFQAFDLSYRFGGVTRRTEHQVKKAYREDKKEFDAIEDIDFAPVNPEDPPPPPPIPPPE